MDKSGVVRVKIEGDNEQPVSRDETNYPVCFEDSQQNFSIDSLFQTHVPFIFVGTAENIANARVLLDYHMASLKV